MGLLEHLINQPNSVISAINTLSKNDCPTYIYGAGNYAKMLYHELLSVNINVSGFFVDDDLYNENAIDNVPVYRFSEITSHFVSPKNIIVGFVNMGVARKKISSLLPSDHVWELDAFPSKCHEQLTYAYISDHLDDFETVYSMCEDSLSRQTLINYINCKISGCSKYLYDIYQTNQYFPPDIIKLSNSEIFVDCGAYTGDTLIDFLSCSHGEYSKIYCFEPCKENYNLLLCTIRSNCLKNVIPCSLGTWNKCDVLHFSENDSVSEISQNGVTTTIPVDSLDNIIPLNIPVSYIKMDVEGAEIESLSGAKGIIQKHRPKLAICVYHKKDDVWKIPSLIKSLNPDYKIYFRQHSLISLELVCYAI